jgi:uncharacterized protein (TIGR00156 family)
MITRRAFLVSACAVLPALPLAAQFTGPSHGQPTTVAEAQNSRPGRYVTLEGNIVAHQREDYYTFRDATGEMRVEIEPGTFAGQEVGPDDRVRIMGEVDTGLSGRYVWVESLSLF